MQPFETEKLGNGSIYTGQMKNKKWHGFGIYKDAGTYTGMFENGDFNGLGTKTWKDGASYIGEWKNDDCNGIGK